MWAQMTLFGTDIKVDEIEQKKLEVTRPKQCRKCMARSLIRLVNLALIATLFDNQKFGTNADCGIDFLKGAAAPVTYGLKIQRVINIRSVKKNELT